MFHLLFCTSLMCSCNFSFFCYFFFIFLTSNYCNRSLFCSLFLYRYIGGNFVYYRWAFHVRIILCENWQIKIVYRSRFCTQRIFIFMAHSKGKTCMCMCMEFNILAVWPSLPTHFRKVVWFFSFEMYFALYFHGKYVTCSYIYSVSVSGVAKKGFFLLFNSHKRK